MTQDGKLFSQRLDRLRKAMRAAEIDAAAIVPGANFVYFTDVHFHLMERPTLLFVAAEGPSHAIIPLLEKARWAAAHPEVESVFWQDSDGFETAFAEVAKRFSPKRLGVEGQRMRFFEADCLRRHFGDAALVDAHAVISKPRLNKDAAEIAALRRAIAISEQAFAKTIATVKAGMSEAAVKQALTRNLMDAGAESLAFEPIVLTGAAAADPHGTASEARQLKRGDALLFDFGAAYGGYNADVTRTVFVEAVSPTHRAIYESVLKANAHGLKLARPGVSLDRIDREVTETLQNDGFADLVLCKTGHGLGLDVHEAPQVMIGNHQLLEPGMVITIEPGLYREGDIGVRIEDDVLVTEDGCVSLTAFDRSLIVVG
jgi:Xaa-Pro dipeptidase